MTVTSLSAFAVSLQYTAVTLGVTATASSPRPAGRDETPASSAAATSPQSSAADTVELSTPASPPPSTDASRSDRLFSLLDANEDGVVSKEEFTQGALALLRRAAARHHQRRVAEDGEDNSRQTRLQNRLDRVFARVDANEDGTIDRMELMSALTQLDARHSGPADRQSSGDGTASTGSNPSPAATVSVTSVTVVAVAIRQYTLANQSVPSTVQATA